MKYKENIKTEVFNSNEKQLLIGYKNENIILWCRRNR